MFASYLQKLTIRLNSQKKDLKTTLYLLTPLIAVIVTIIVVNSDSPGKRISDQPPSKRHTYLIKQPNIDYIDSKKTNREIAGQNIVTENFNSAQLHASSNYKNK